MFFRILNYNYFLLIKINTKTNVYLRNENKIIFDGNKIVLHLTNIIIINSY